MSRVLGDKRKGDEAKMGVNTDSRAGNAAGDQGLDLAWTWPRAQFPEPQTSKSPNRNSILYLGSGLNMNDLIRETELAPNIKISHFEVITTCSKNLVEWLR